MAGLPSNRVLKPIPWLAGLGTGAIASTGPAGLLACVAVLLGIALLTMPETGVLAAVLLKPLVDCLWSLRVIPVAGTFLNLQSLVGIVLPVCLALALIRRRVTIRAEPIQVLLITYLVFTAIGIVRSPVRSAAVGDFGRIGFSVLFFWAGVLMSRTERSVRILMWSLAAYGTVPVITAALQLLGIVHPLTGSVRNPTDVIRLTGLYHHPLEIAMRASLAFPFGLALAGLVRAPYVRRSLRAWSIVVGLASCATLVRSALVANLVQGWLWLVGRR